MPAPTAASNGRQDEALRLRGLGYSWHEIAARCGYASHGAAQYAVRAARMRLGATLTHYGADDSSNLPRWARRSFGIEVEHNGIALSNTRRALVNAGLQAIEDRYSARAPQGVWKCTHDGSCGNEAVSPVLNDEAGLNELRDAMRAISNAGGHVDRRCGTHVHLDTSDLDGPAIARFVKLYVDHQEDIDDLMPRSRRGNYYARRVDVVELDTIVQAFTAMRSTPRGWGQERRYRSINVMAFPKHGTIEIRQHQGTLNFGKLRAWVMLLMAMVEVARLDRCAEVETGEQFVASIGRVAGMKRATVRRLEQRRTMAGVR